MATIRRSALTAALFACLCGPCKHVYAGPQVSIELNTDNPNSDFNAFSIIVDGDGYDWLSIAMEIVLTEGEIHNEDLGTGVSFDNPLPQFWDQPFFGALEWDTWVGEPGDENAFGPFTVGLDPAEWDNSMTSLSGQHFLAAWASTTTTQTGPTRIANISTTLGATGTWRMYVSFNGSPIQVFEPEGTWPVVIPEPIGISCLLPVSALMVLRRGR